MSRVCRVGAVAIACGWALFASGSAQACGGGGVASKVGVTTNAQRIFMSVRANGTTDIVAQIAVTQTTADYSVLIPVPDEPTLDSEPVSVADFNALDQATAPVVIDAGGGDSGGPGCGCIGAGANDDDSASAPERTVIVSSQTTIGPVVAVSLTGENGDAVRAWLTDNGFSLPQSDAAMFDRYVGKGRYFIAIKRNPETTGAGATGGGARVASSMGIHYTLPGDHRMLSLGFTQIGAASTMALTLFLAAPQTVGPTEPFKALTLNDIDANTLRTNNYALAVQTAVAARDSKAFVLESSTPIASIAKSAPGLARFVDDGATVTRATTVLPRAKIEDDVVFSTPFPNPVPSQRFVSVGGEHVRYAGMGALALLLTAGALRRRARPRPRQ